MDQNGLGARVRRRLGRWETPAAEAYRSAFINLDDLATVLRSVTSPKRVLEIGCGDGSVADRICAGSPEIQYLGIDVSPEPGRRFTGPAGQATFRSQLSSDLLAEAPEPFDLVLIVDVLHHVDQSARRPLLADAAAMTAPGGYVAVKEWEWSRSIGHVLTHAADRYISGDRSVRFMRPEELQEMVVGAFPGWNLACETRVPPHRNNALIILQKPPAADG